MATRIYTHTAGEEKNYGSGRFLKIQAAAAGTVSIELQAKDGTTIDILEGLSQGDAIEYAPGFAQAKIKSSSAQTLTIQVLQVLLKGTNMLGDVNVLTFPTGVQVSDYDNSINGFEYIGGSDSIALTSNYTGLALYNPIGSTKTLICKRLLIGARSTGPVSIRALAAGIPAAWADLTTANVLKHSKIIGGANGLGKIYGGFTTTKTGDEITEVYSGSSAAIELLDGKKAIHIPVGSALVVQGVNQNDPQDATFEWEEV